ncbi:MAG: deoxyribonuclease IV [Acidobacteria bacterium]|nr:deoxyribonuclease IV [Acidobacteriota bacterium]
MMTVNVRIGLHTSTAGGLHKAAEQAIDLGANTFQIFSGSPRMWHASMPRSSEVAALNRLRLAHDLAPLVIHGNYLINLASLDPQIRAKSIIAFRGELERARVIGAEYLVIHPGSYKDQSVEQGIYSFIEAMTEAVEGLDAGGVTLLLENTAGQGKALGSRLEELAQMRQMALERTSLRIGYCIDTCHALAAGYDIAHEEGLALTVEFLDHLLGLGHIPVIHANDSQGALGSHLDRHANIGLGQIGEAGFARIMQHPQLRDKAFILETPQDDGADRRDIAMLKQLGGSGQDASE